jgi:hypothetical protein
MIVSFHWMQNKTCIPRRLVAHRGELCPCDILIIYFLYAASSTSVDGKKCRHERIQHSKDARSQHAKDAPLDWERISDP